MNIEIKKGFFEKYIGYILMIIIACFAFICYHIKDKELLKCHKLTIGIIKEIHLSPRGPGGTEYKYYINGIEYIGLSTDKFYKSLIRRQLPLIYSCDDPSYSKLLVEPSDFEKYGYSFPDSLKWVLPLLNNE